MPLGSQERRRKWGSSVSRTPTSTLPAISSDVLEVSCQSLCVYVVLELEWVLQYMYLCIQIHVHVFTYMYTVPY